MASLFTSMLAQIAQRPEARVLREIFGVVDALVDDKRTKFERVLPLADYFVDRWDKARALGFGEGSSVYDSCLVIGDPSVGKKCWFGPFTVVDGSGGLSIGDGCTFSAGSQVYTHDNIAQTLDGTSPIERAPTRIGSNVYVGPNAVITRGITIGDRVVIGANSLVMIDVPDGSKVAGNPARIVGTL